MKVLVYSICAAASCGMAIASPIGEAIGKHLDGGDLPGAVSVVVDAQGRMTVDCRGYADLATKTPMRSDTIFWLASNTKAIAAATLMTLVDEGKVKLDDPVSKYLPAFANVTVEAKDGARPPTRPMTVRMTLSHMSGLPFFPGMPIDKRPISELARLATVTPLAADPGERYAYSNWGIDVAMAVVEKVTGRSFAAVMKERILAPRQRHAVVYRLPNTIPISIYHNVKLFAEIAQAKISSKALHSVQREVVTCWGSYRTTIWPDFASIFASTD